MYQSGDLVELEKVQRKAAEVKGMEAEKAGTQLQFGGKELSRDMTGVCLFTKVLG